MVGVTQTSGREMGDVQRLAGCCPHRTHAYVINRLQEDEGARECCYSGGTGVLGREVGGQRGGGGVGMSTYVGDKQR